MLTALLLSTAIISTDMGYTSTLAIVEHVHCTKHQDFEYDGKNEWFCSMRFDVDPSNIHTLIVDSPVEIGDEFVLAAGRHGLSLMQSR